MTESSLRIYACAERPDLIKKREKTQSVWDAFMNEDPIANRYWNYLYEYFPQFQFFFCYGNDDEVIAEAITIPFSWDMSKPLPDTGWDAVMEGGMLGYREGVQPNTLSALAATISKEAQGRGLSRVLLQTMKCAAQENGLQAFVAPVRPSQKHLYPLMPMERYITWTADDSGAPSDAWLRTHWRLGAKIVKVAPESMRITGTIAEWEGWTGMRFPESGTYIVPGALSPVEMDLERDEGVYVEANVWMQHPMG